MNSKKMLLSLFLVLPFLGCSQLVNKFEENNFTPTKLHNLVKAGTSIVLNQSKPDKESLVQVKTNLEKIKANLEQNQLVDFDNLKNLVDVPQEYQFVIYTILDLTENYIKTYVSDFLKDNKKSVEFVLAGINGGLTAINSYLNN